MAGCQCLVGQPLVYDLSRYLLEPLPVLLLAGIVPEILFRQIPLLMLRRHDDVGSVIAPIQKVPVTFNPVGVSLRAVFVLNHVLPVLVVNCPMLVMFRQSVVSLRGIGEQVGVFFDVFQNLRLKRLLCVVGNDHRSDFAVTLAETHDCRLREALLSHLLALAAMHVFGFAADVGFIAFDFAFQRLHATRLHDVADTMKQKPSGLLSNTEIPRNLTGGNAVLRVSDQPHSREPGFEGKTGGLKNRTDANREAFAARSAVPNLLRSDEREFSVPTVGAFDAVRPMHVLGILEAYVRVAEVFNSLD